MSATNDTYTPFTAYPERGNVRQDELAGIEHRMTHRSQVREAVVIRDLISRGKPIHCSVCGDDFFTASPGISRKCPSCRTAAGNATRQRGTKV